MKLSEAIETIGQVGDQLTKVSSEITAKLDELANSDPDISPEGQAAIERVRKVAQALDDLVPDVGPDDEAPEVQAIV